MFSCPTYWDQITTYKEKCDGIMLYEIEMNKGKNNKIVFKHYRRILNLLVWIQTFYTIILKISLYKFDDNGNISMQVFSL